MTKHVPVTDHAVLRYLERVKGFDIEAVRREIAALCREAGGARSMTRDGVRYEFGNAGQVITMHRLTGGRLPSRTRKAVLARGGGANQIGTEN